MTHSYFTIGHSTRSVDELAALLRQAGAGLLVDVRTVPRSRYNPQFNDDTLPGSLAARGIGYRHLRSLGGRRQQQAGPSPNDFWKEGGFRAYADYALTPPFAEGLAELRALRVDHTPALMCAEADWHHCHRRFIADYLIAGGDTVKHILGPGRIETGILMPQAVKRSDGTLAYPCETLSLGL